MVLALIVPVSLRFFRVVCDELRGRSNTIGAKHSVYLGILSNGALLVQQSVAFADITYACIITKNRIISVGFFELSQN